MKDGLSYALKVLGIKDYFREELRGKIAAKFDAEEADRTIEAIDSYGYLNDEKTARNYASWKLRSGYGAYYIVAKLRFKGVDMSVSEIEQVAHEEEIDTESLIKKLAERYTTEETDDPYKTYGKCISFLQSRGYPLQLCLKIVKKGDFEK